MDLYRHPIQQKAAALSLVAMTHPVLRRAVFEDVDEIRALVLAAYARWEGVTPRPPQPVRADYGRAFRAHRFDLLRSEEHTSELQSLMRISYAVFCLKKKQPENNNTAH